MNQKYKYLSKNILLNVIGKAGTRVIVFFMIPLYTNYMSASSYGTADLITTTVNIFMPVFTICTDVPLMRYCLDEQYKKIEVVSSAFYILMRGFLLLGIFSIIASVFPFGLESGYAAAFALISCSSGLLMFANGFSRGMERVRDIIETSIVSTLFTCLFNILFIAVLKTDLQGYFLSIILGNIAGAVWGFFRSQILNYIRLRAIKKNIVLSMQKFSFPLIFNQIGWWLNNSVDKYITSYFLGVSQNGLYSIAYKLPNILTVLSGVFASAWGLSGIKEFDPKDSDGFVSKTYSYYQAFLVLGASVLLLFNIPIAKILYAKEFYTAWKYTGILVIAAVFHSLAGFMTPFFSAVNNTKPTAVSTLAGGIVNVVVSLAWVKLAGIYGVACGTLISNVIIFAIRYMWAKKYIDLRIDFKWCVFVYIVLAADAVLGMFGAELWVHLMQSGIVFFVLVLYREQYNTLLKRLLYMIGKEKQED